MTMQAPLPLSERDKVCFSCPLPFCHGGDASCPWGRAKSLAGQRPSLADMRCERILQLLEREGRPVRSAVIGERLKIPNIYTYLARLRARELVVLSGGSRNAVWGLADDG